MTFQVKAYLLRDLLPVKVNEFWHCPRPLSAKTIAGPNWAKCFIELFASIIHWVISGSGKCAHWAAYQWIQMRRRKYHSQIHTHTLNTISYTHKNYTSSFFLSLFLHHTFTLPIFFSFFSLSLQIYTECSNRRPSELPPTVQAEFVWGSLSINCTLATTDFFSL